jgi:hypothetical protein
VLSLFEGLMNRPASPVKKMRNGNNNKKLPCKMLDYLERKFLLLPKDMLPLRYVECKRFLGTLPARSIRIYDQKAVENNGVEIKTFDDLDKHSELMLYKGYVLNNDIIYLTEQNTSLAIESYLRKEMKKKRGRGVHLHPDHKDVLVAK